MLLNESTGERKVTLDVQTLMLTREQLLENEYPVPNYISESSQLSGEWIQSPEYIGEEVKVLALDCEMVCKFRT